MNIELSFLGKQHQLKIDKAHFIRRLGYPKDYEVSEEIKQSMQKAVDWYNKNGTPWLAIFEVDVNLKDDKICLNNIEVHAPKVHKRFQKYSVRKALLIATTAGGNVDTKAAELWNSDLPDTAFFLETFAACVTETNINFAVEYIKNWTAQKGMNSLSRYSPGYPGWDLKEQFLLMDVISKTNTIIPITINENALLSPLRSLLSLVGIYQGKQEKEVSNECKQCNFIDCKCKDTTMFIKNKIVIK